MLREAGWASSNTCSHLFFGFPPLDSPSSFYSKLAHVGPSPHWFMYLRNDLLEMPPPGAMLLSPLRTAGTIRANDLLSLSDQFPLAYYYIAPAPSPGTRLAAGRHSAAPKRGLLVTQPSKALEMGRTKKTPFAADSRRPGHAAFVGAVPGVALIL